jgi:hypothetical protein
MSNVTIDAAQLQTLLDTVKSQNEALERLQRSDSERVREDAARAESRQRQHSVSIASDAEERNRGREHQLLWDEAYSNLGRVAPVMKEGETAEAYRLRLASGVQACSPDHRDVDLETVLLRQPPSSRETILSQIRQDALRPEARHVGIADGEIREFKRRDESGREVTEFVSSDGKTTFIQMMARPRQIVRRMFGVDRIGNGSTRPVEKPHNGPNEPTPGLPAQRLNTSQSLRPTRGLTVLFYSFLGIKIARSIVPSGESSSLAGEPDARPLHLGFGGPYCAPHALRGARIRPSAQVFILPASTALFFLRPRPMPTTRDPPTHPPFPIKQGRFPTPGLTKLDPLCLPPNAEPLQFMLAVMRDETQPIWRRIEAATAAAPYRHIRLDGEFFRNLTPEQLNRIKNARVIDHKCS